MVIFGPSVKNIRQSGFGLMDPPRYGNSSGKGMEEQSFWFINLTAKIWKIIIKKQLTLHTLKIIMYYVLHSVSMTISTDDHN